MELSQLITQDQLYSQVLTLHGAFEAHFYLKENTQSWFCGGLDQFLALKTNGLEPREVALQGDFIPPSNAALIGFEKFQIKWTHASPS